MLGLSLAILPVVARAQAMQSVCKDGTKSAAAGAGTCSGHGGVDDQATKTLAASGKMVMCTDGTMSAGGRGSCSGHGGIGKGTANQKREMKAEKKEMKEAMMDKKQEAKMDKKQEARMDKKQEAMMDKKQEAMMDKKQEARKEMKQEAKMEKKEAKADAKAMAMEAKRPPKATGKCKDGSYTETKTRAGACTGHGGIGSWY